MKFCTKCDKPLEFIESIEGELCSDCVSKSSSVHEAAAKPALDLEDLAGASLSVENGKIILKSLEGWTLWSAPVGERTELQTILTRGKRILEIRKKNRKRN